MQTSRVRGCDYLWVSHFHPDHYHPPTLKRVLEVHPGIAFIGNRSVNFQLDDAARALGFSRVVPLDERVPIDLGSGVSVERFPATGTDAVVVDYNDCVLPPPAKKALARKIGPATRARAPSSIVELDYALWMNSSSIDVTDLEG